MQKSLADIIQGTIEKHKLRPKKDNAGQLLSALVEDEHVRVAGELTGAMSSHEKLSRSTFIGSFLQTIETDFEVAPPEPELNLRSLQTQIGLWAQENFGSNQSKRTGYALYSLAPLLGIGEEYGELLHCVLKNHQAIRGYDDVEKYETERDDALADLLIYMCDFATREGVDLLSVLNDTWRRVVARRNWKANPSEGKDSKDVED